MGESQKLLQEALDKNADSPLLALLVKAACDHDLTGNRAASARKLIKESNVAKICCDIEGSASCASNNTMMCLDCDCAIAHQDRATESTYAYLAGTAVCAHCVHWHVILSVFDQFTSSGLLPKIDDIIRKIAPDNAADIHREYKALNRPTSSSSSK